MGSSSENITLTAGTGTVAIGAIGTGSEIADVSITSSGDTNLHGDFTGGALTITGPVIIAENINIGTGAVSFGSTLDSHTGAQTITFNNPGADINITGAIGGSNPFSTFTISDAGTFTYSGGGSISGFSSGKFSRTGGFAKFNPGPAIDNINTIEKTQNKEISFFDAPVFKLIRSFVTPTVADLIKQKAPLDEDNLEAVVTGPALSNTDFLDKDSRIGNEIEETDIEVDFLDGDKLIIDKSLEVASYEFDSLETSVEEIFDDSLLEDSSNVSINSAGDELFKTSSLNQINEKTKLEELLISFSKNEYLNEGKSFIF